MQFLKRLSKSELRVFANLCFEGRVICICTPHNESPATNGFRHPNRLTTCGLRFLFLATCQTLHLTLRTLVDTYGPIVRQHRERRERMIDDKQTHMLSQVARGCSMLRVGQILQLQPATSKVYNDYRKYRFRFHAKPCWQFQITELVPRLLLTSTETDIVIPRLRLLTDVTPCVESTVPPHEISETMRNGAWSLFPYCKWGPDWRTGIIPFGLEMYTSWADESMKHLRVGLDCSKADFLSLLDDARQSINQSRREGLLVLAGHMKHNPTCWFYHLPRAVSIHITSFLVYLV